MRMVICVVRDRAIDAFGMPMFVTHVGAAVRSFSDEINTAGTQLNKHPDDFDLYVLGSYNDEDGSFEVHSPKQVAIGKDHVKKERVSA